MIHLYILIQFIINKDALIVSTTGTTVLVPRGRKLNNILSSKEVKSRG